MIMGRGQARPEIDPASLISGLTLTEIGQAHSANVGCFIHAVNLLLKTTLFCSITYFGSVH